MKYCGRACQAAHWKGGHKKACKKAGVAAAAPTPPPTRGANPSAPIGFNAPDTDLGEVYNSHRISGAIAHAARGGEAGVVAALARMGAHMEDGGVQQEALFELDALVSTGGGAKLVATTPGGLETVVRAMATHRKAWMLQSIAAKVLLDVVGSLQVDKCSAGKVHTCTTVLRTT